MEGVGLRSGSDEALGGVDAGSSAGVLMRRDLELDDAVLLSLNAAGAADDTAVTAVAEAPPWASADWRHSAPPSERTRRQQSGQNGTGLRWWNQCCLRCR